MCGFLQHIEFPDNQDVLDLIDNRKGGIIALLDEQCIVPRGSDAGLISNLAKTLFNHPRCVQGLLFCT